ncbi:hypothetical protein GGX14DRAFT_446696 [Mycena pura]|uniref:Uncharacterized protein n=1 Tax=Mycena pura TaxID=153505 RepID=A0AAD6VKL9_9AGAR|nr:hypothetical protein GGX14DRAFT_446696 [Mycena pura]
MALLHNALVLAGLAIFTPRVSAAIIFVHHNTGLSSPARIAIIVVCVVIVVLAIACRVARMRQARRAVGAVILEPVPQGPPHPPGSYPGAYGPPPVPGQYPPMQTPPMQTYYAPGPYAQPAFPQRTGSEEEKGLPPLVYDHQRQQAPYYAPPPLGTPTGAPGAYQYASPPALGPQSTFAGYTSPPGPPPPGAGYPAPPGPPPPSSSYPPPTDLPPPFSGYDAAPNPAAPAHITVDRKGYY